MIRSDADEEEDDELGNSDVREIYKQHQNNMRSFVVLRFRHFTTFSVVMAFIATISVQSLSKYDEQLYAAILGLFVIGWFWLLDFRSGEYLRYHAGVSTAIEKEFLRLEKRVEFRLPPFPKPQWLSATHTTNFIFLTILLGWCGFLITLPHTTIDKQKAEVVQNAPKTKREAAVVKSKPRTKVSKDDSTAQTELPSTVNQLTLDGIKK
jgi:hypothetical protein